MIKLGSQQTLLAVTLLGSLLSAGAFECPSFVAGFLLLSRTLLSVTVYSFSKFTKCGDT